MTADGELVQLMDAALADSVRRSGKWLACRPGCHQCCTGVFAIAPSDAERLRRGLGELHKADPEAARRIDERVRASAGRLLPTFPGNPATGELATDEASQEAFEAFANDEVCPVLDPVTHTCDLYAFRPMTCRTFGPPVRTAEGALGVCELCFVGAPEAEVASAELHLPQLPDEQEEANAEKETIVTFALLQRATL